MTTDPDLSWAPFLRTWALILTPVVLVIAALVSR